MSPLLHVVLIHPKIPQNTGNIGRLVCAMGGRLHLVEPLGFDTDERAVRRAGLDYWEHLDWRRHADLQALRTSLGDARCFGFSTRAAQVYSDVRYAPGDCLLFGDEVSGLPDAVLNDSGVTPVRIPLRSPHVRSFNLANAVAMATAELTRQLGHPDALPPKSPDQRSRELSCKPN